MIEIKNKYPVSILIFILIWGSSLHASGTVLTESIYSPALDEMRNYTIYLPEGYEESEEEYPVLYYLHGFLGTHLSNPAVFAVADSLADEGLGLDMIIVKANSTSEPYVGCFYNNSALNGDYEDYIVNDVVAHIDSTYRTIDHRRARGISGHSMGAYGAMKLCLKHPDIFGSVSSHSGHNALGLLVDLIPDLLGELVDGEFHPENGNVTNFLIAFSAALTPDLTDPPYYVDMPFTTEGDVIDEVFDLWMLEDPLSIAMADPEILQSLGIFFDCGDEDVFLSHSDTFHAYLESEEIEHVYINYHGSHTADYDGRFRYSQLFHAEQFLAFINEVLPGDLDGSGAIDVVDIVLVIGLILNSDYDEIGDINADGSLDVLDVVLLVDLIVSQ